MPTSRHGESMFNTQGLIGGNPPLSLLGEEYAKVLVDYVEESEELTTDEACILSLLLLLLLLLLGVVMVVVRTWRGGVFGRFFSCDPWSSYGFMVLVSIPPRPA